MRMTSIVLLWLALGVAVHGEDWPQFRGPTGQGHSSERGLPVEFRVDAYRDEVFYGEIEQIRKNSTKTENVVTYPVVVAAPNPDLKLLPGMTASLSFQVDERKDVLCVPNAALRFYPDATQVRPEDREELAPREREVDAVHRHHGTVLAHEAARLQHGLHGGHGPRGLGRQNQRATRPAGRPVVSS